MEPVRFGRYAVSLSTQQLVAILSIAVLTVVNTRGLNAGRLIQNTLTWVKGCALLGMIVVGLSLGWTSGGSGSNASWWNPWANGWTPQQARPGFEVHGGLALLMLLGLAMVGPLFSQSGWNNVTFVGGEVHEPGRNLPGALVKGKSCLMQGEPEGTGDSHAR